MGLAACVIGIFLSCPTIRVVDAQNHSAIEPSGRRLTVKDVIEATQVLHDYGTDPILISPNGKRYLVLLQRGDVARNGSWIELLSGGTLSLDAATNVDTVARLFTKSTAQLTDLVKNLHWLNDNEHVVFLWDDGLVPSQIIEVSTVKQKVQALTRHSTMIEKYDVSPDGKTLVFMARTPRDPSATAEMLGEGFAISNQSIWSLLQGNVDGWTPWRNYETYVVSQTKKAPRKVQEPSITWVIGPDLLRISPDGNYAIANRPVPDVPSDWDVYTEHVFKDMYLPGARQHPGSPNWVRRYVIIDLRQGTSRPLWNAPEDPHGEVVWSPDSRRVMIGPTFLPAADLDVTGRSGRAVAEVDVDTGRYTQLPLPQELKLGYRPLSWDKNDEVELGDADISKQHAGVLRYRKSANGLEQIAAVEPSQTASSVRIELRQDPNTPPALFAVDPANNRERLIRELNPQLGRGIRLAKVELIHWKATDGRPWSGLLYYPVSLGTGGRFPLVIQTHGYSTTEFSLDGAFTTAFAAQPLANRDIAVLQLGGPDTVNKDDYSMTPREPGVALSGIEGAVEHFNDIGLIDPEKVGIIGFSWTVFTVEYVLTHSQYRFAAAEVADGIDGGYFQYVLASSDERPFQQALKGGAPFGEGLKKWFAEAPGFLGDRVQTPLRMEIDTGPLDEVLTHWELFSNLRYLQKPVELFVIPHIEKGTHVLQNPAQRLASQGGAVDWFCFWLKGEEDPDPAKTDQYHRWREMRELQDHNGSTTPAIKPND